MNLYRFVGTYAYLIFFLIVFQFFSVGSHNGRKLQICYLKKHRPKDRPKNMILGYVPKNIVQVFC